MIPKNQKHAYRIIQVLVEAQGLKLHPRALKNQVAFYLSRTPYQQSEFILQTLARSGHDTNWFHRMIATEVTKEILKEAPPQPVKAKPEPKKKLIKPKKGKKSK